MDETSPSLDAAMELVAIKTVLAVLIAHLAAGSPDALRYLATLHGKALAVAADISVVMPDDEDEGSPAGDLCGLRDMLARAVGGRVDAFFESIVPADGVGFGALPH